MILPFTLKFFELEAKKISSATEQGMLTKQIINQETRESLTHEISECKDKILVIKIYLPIVRYRQTGATTQIHKNMVQI